MYQKPSKIAVPPLADAKHLGFASRGILLRNEAKPGGQVTGFLKLLTVSSSCEKCCGPQRAYSWYRHQSTGLLVAGRQCLDLSRDLGDALLQSHQILEELIKQPPHCRGQVVAFVGNDPGQIRFEETGALADRDSVLEAKGSHLADQSCSASHHLITDAMQTVKF